MERDLSRIHPFTSPNDNGLSLEGQARPAQQDCTQARAQAEAQASKPLDLERERQLQALAQTRERIAAMEALLNDLPALFEAKFRERLQPLLDQQQQLLADNADLRQQLLLLRSAGQGQRRLRVLPLPSIRRLRPSDDAPPTTASVSPTRR